MSKTEKLGIGSVSAWHESLAEKIGISSDHDFQKKIMMVTITEDNSGLRIRLYRLHVADFNKGGIFNADEYIFRNERFKLLKASKSKDPSKHRREKLPFPSKERVYKYNILDVCIVSYNPLQPKVKSFLKQILQGEFM